MKIVGFQKLTLSDYPGHTACIIFTEGCNFKCPFCHNSPLVYDVSSSYYEESEIFSYLEKRKGIVEGIVVSGGEPTLQKDLIRFLKRLREIDVLIKLDTNGSNPKILKEILDNNLVDYVAMDIKNTYEKYDTICDTKVNIKNIKESIKLLKESNIDHEFRTTIVKEFHTKNDIKEITEYIKGSKYYIQNFRDNENVIYDNLHSFTEKEIDDLKKEVKDFNVRGNI